MSHDVIGAAAMHHFQARFVDALFGRRGASALTLSLAAQPAFAVYRNTVLGACADALAANFPSVARLLGADAFRGVALGYVHVAPPRDARLLLYGDGFADYLGDHQAMRGLPYVAGVARLDRCWIEAHVAADAEPVDAAVLSDRGADALARTRLEPHPAARWHWAAEGPVRTIWRRERELRDEPLQWTPGAGEGTLLTRPHEAVLWQPIDAAHCAFLDACASGAALPAAAAAALQVEPGTDVAALLALLLRAGALCAAEVAETDEAMR